MSEIYENDVQRAVLATFPDAELSADDDGQLVINTNCMWSGKNGDFVLGNINVERRIYTVITSDHGITDVEFLDKPPTWDLDELGQVCFVGNLNGGDARRYQP